MSTIHDALKKTQKNMPDDNPISSHRAAPIHPHNPFNPPSSATPGYDPATPDADTPEKNRKTRSKFFIFLLFLLIIVAMGFTTVSVFPKVRGFLMQKKSLLTKALQPALPSPAAKQPVKKTEIILQGIMIMEQENLALINGAIYETGDTVNDCIIEEISRNTVTLTTPNGNRKVLQTSQ